MRERGDIFDGIERFNLLQGSDGDLLADKCDINNQLFYVLLLFFGKRMQNIARYLCAVLRFSYAYSYADILSSYGIIDRFYTIVSTASTTFFKSYCTKRQINIIMNDDDFLSVNFKKLFYSHYAFA